MTTNVKNSYKGIHGESLFVPTGSTLLNLQCSGNPYCGFPLGKIVNIPGESSSGKTLLSFTVLAEASLLKQFDNYSFVFDDAESANQFNIEKLFGSKLFERLEPPKYEKNGSPLSSATVEDFMDNISNFADSGKPFIYILDSLDTLTTTDELNKFETDKDARSKDKDVTGSYGADKPKKMSGFFRILAQKMEQTDSLLIILSQTRDNLKGYGKAKIRSGGNALQFSSSLVIWTKSKQDISKTINNEKYKIGSVTECTVDKNKVNGTEGSIEFPIMHNYGIDDLMSCTNYLLEKKVWSVDKRSIVADNIDFKGSMESLIKKIETDNLQEKVIECVADTWNKIKEQLDSSRVKKYV